MNETTLTQFVQLFTLSDAGATQRVAERLALVLRDPQAYTEQFAEELEERDITVVIPEQELRNVALIDALLSEELLWEADWKDSGADLVYGLNETLTQQRRTMRLHEPTSGQANTSGPEALDILQDLLEPLSLALVLLTLDTDSFALSLVAEEQAEEARKLAQDLGFSIAVY
jgi:energy-coupling factor transporter ATP-binding protein EcfA2